MSLEMYFIASLRKFLHSRSVREVAKSAGSRMNTDSVAARAEAGWLSALIKMLRAVLRKETIFSIIVFEATQNR